MNRYFGNTGRVVKVETRQPARRQTQSKGPAPAPPPRKKARESGEGLSRLLSGLTEKLQGGLQGLETEDLILFLVLYLMYRDSGDSEPLIILAAMLFL